MTKKIRVYLAMSEDICMYTQQSRCTIYKHKYKLVYQKNCLLPGRPQSFIYCGTRIFKPYYIQNLRPQ